MERGLKKAIGGLILGFAAMISIPVSAENVVNKAYLAEQAKGKAPNVKVYMTGNEMKDDLKMEGSLGELQFTQSGDIQSFEASGESVRYIVLFDNSGSIDIDQFEPAKQELIKLRKNLKNSDEMQLFTVGTLDIAGDRTDVFGRTAVATETDKVNADCEKIEAIEYLGGPESKTILYRSMNEIIEQQSYQIGIDSIRSVFILITDGEDDSDDINGKNNDKDTTLRNVQNAMVPLYAVLLNDTAREPDEEKIKFTKNQLLDPANGRGYFANCSMSGVGKNKSEEEKETAEKLVKDGFAAITDVIGKQTYVVNFKAGHNTMVVGKNDLNLMIDGKTVAKALLDYSDYEEDREAPKIIGIVEKDGMNSVSFMIEDENGVNLEDASDITHYVITSVSDEKVWAIDQVNANNDGDGVSVILTVNEEQFYNDDYTLQIDGIRDCSQDQNEMKNITATFTVEDGLSRSAVERKRLIQGYWWILLILAVIAIGIPALILFKKRAVKVIEINPEELTKRDTRLIRLTITDRQGLTREVEYTVEGSVFVGRSNICEIFFDDDRLSKQHFVIEVTKMGCNIIDLDSTNGTFVNGVKLTEKRLLADGDVILAGRETFVFHLPQQLASEDEELFEGVE